MPNLTPNYNFKKPLPNEYARPDAFNDNFDSLDAKLKTVSDNATPDTALSPTSKKPVQNKIIKAALDGKSDAGHTHSGYLTEHQDISGKLDKSGGTMTGALTAKSPAVAVNGVRNIKAGTADLTAGSSALATGDTYFVYE